MVNRFIYESTISLCINVIYEGKADDKHLYIKGSIGLCVNVIYQGKDDGKQIYI